MENCSWEKLQRKDRSFDSASILENELGSLNAERNQKLQIQGPRKETVRKAATCLTQEMNESSTVVAALK